MSTFDAFWSSLGTSIFWSSSSAANVTWSRLRSRLHSVSCDYEKINYQNIERIDLEIYSFCKWFLSNSFLRIFSWGNCFDNIISEYFWGYFFVAHWKRLVYILVGINFFSKQIFFKILRANQIKIFLFTHMHIQQKLSKYGLLISFTGINS